MTQQMDQYGDPLSGGRLYFFVAGTVSTPQNAFQDGALTLPWPNPITLDATGRVPQLFLADGLVKVRLTDVHGVTQLVADNLQVIGPSSGGGGGGTSVDPTTVYQTGDLKPRYGTGAHTGWVRCNGNSIGPTGSPANERSNSDTQALFQHLWNTDTNLAVSGGRGTSALADWNAGNKAISVPDWRGYGIAGLDDMGAVAAGRLTAAYFGTAATVLGAAGGVESDVLIQSQLPSVAPTFNGTAGTVNVTSNTPDVLRNPSGVLIASPGSGGFGVGTGAGAGFSLPSSGSFTPAGTISALGSNAPHKTIGPRKLVTIYIKL
jgi:microcystin-dependent protein